MLARPTRRRLQKPPRSPSSRHRQRDTRHTCEPPSPVCGACPILSKGCRQRCAFVCLSTHISTPPDTASLTHPESHHPPLAGSVPRAAPSKEVGREGVLCPPSHCPTRGGSDDTAAAHVNSSTGGGGSSKTMQPAGSSRRRRSFPESTRTRRRGGALARRGGKRLKARHPPPFCAPHTLKTAAVSHTPPLTAS